MGGFSVIIAFLLLGALWFAAVLTEHDIHPMRRLVEWMRHCSSLELVLVASMVAGPIYRAGSKTNGVNGVGGGLGGGANVANVEMLPITNTNVQWEGSAQLENGNIGTGILHFTFYTLHSHTNLDWLAFGGYEDWFYLDGGGWCFRFGSNLVERLTVFSCGEISPAPYDASNRISLLGLPLSIVPAANWHLLSPQQSLFWHSETPSNTLLLTWQNALVNRDTNLPVTVQAELFPDGAAALRYGFDGIGDIKSLSNAEAQIWRDGVLATNYQLPTIDYQLSTTNCQLNSFFEAPPITGTNGIAEVYARIAGGNTNAYYCADVVVSKGPAKIRVEPIEDETNRGLLGAYEIVAMPGETNRLPLLIGPKYAVSAETAFGSFELVPPPFVPLADDTGTVERLSFGDALTLTLTNITDRLVEVGWPVEFALEEIDATPEATTYALRITPDWLDGVVTWHGIVDTNAPPMRGAPPMRSGGASCSCGCLVRDGLDLIHSKTSSCEHCSAEGKCLYEGHTEDISIDMKDSSSGGEPPGPGGGGGNDTPPPNLPSVSVSFDKDVVIFEDRYENSPGVFVERRSTKTKLTLTAYGGENGGTVALQQARELVESPDNSPMPTLVPANTTVNWEGYFEGQSASSGQNGTTVRATFWDGQAGNEVASASAYATVVKVSFSPVKRAPANNVPTRHTLGVCEQVNCVQDPTAPAVTWTTFGGYNNDNQNGPTNVYHCPLYADSEMLRADIGEVTYTPLLTVIEPQGVITGVVAKLPFEPHPNKAGFVGMSLELFVLPLEVSFAYTQIEEVPSNQGTHSGYFGNIGLSRWWYHTTDNGAGVWKVVEDSNRFMFDQVKVNEEFYQIQPEGEEPMGWIEGNIEWHVPYGWKENPNVVSQEPYGQFATHIRQQFHITANGTVSITKHGSEIVRGTNDVTMLNGVVQQ